jgi:Sensors of blue-light using FAD
LHPDRLLGRLPGISSGVRKLLGPARTPKMHKAGIKTVPKKRKKTTMNSKHEDPPGEVFYNLLYCSHATDLIADDELQQIVKTSQRNNSGKGITGLLVYGGGMFLQWLEGPRPAVEALMTALGTDPRHETIVRLQVLEGLKERLYPSWAMQNVAPKEIREIMIDCLSRARSERHAEMISLMIELLKTDQLAPLRA